MKIIAGFTVNGHAYELAIEPHWLLIEVLREALGFTGTKHSCGVGNCGACTVLLDGEPVLACMTLAMAARGRSIVTIEGLADGPDLHPLQQAFIDYGAIQCGYCTPGMILAAKALLDREPYPTEDDVRHALSGNICRCTGYVKIVEAVLAAAAVLRGETPPPPGSGGLLASGAATVGGYTGGATSGRGGAATAEGSRP
jgi:aerobic-type carbon monoxide dehydrogenase small subunit (CoxS/CutS family)